MEIEWKIMKARRKAEEKDRERINVRDSYKHITVQR
jgi:hypothetical protein